jgi:hypothetical protein
VVVRDVARVRDRRCGDVRDRGTGRGCCDVAIASAAVTRSLTGSPRSWRVLGSSNGGWWCTAGNQVLVFSVDRSVRLPNSVVVGTRGAPLADPVDPGDRVVVGNGLAACRSRRWRIVRWWDPRVAAVAIDPTDVVETVRTASRLVQLDHIGPLMAAIRQRDDELLVEEIGRLIGRGEGLTPEGDDVVTGVIAGCRHIGAAIDDGTMAALLDRIRPTVTTLAARSTTLLSSSLLGHAFDAEVAAPVAELLRSLTSRAELTAALAAARAIGHHSGPALAAGVVAGAAAACGVEP